MTPQPFHGIPTFITAVVLKVYAASSPNFGSYVVAGKFYK
jgi:hypothetical protein